MADISAEIAAFQNAVYGEEVRSSMVSAIEKINDVAEDAESTVESFSSGVTQAISNANTAASAANTAASNANTKASAANTAATNANTARTAANNAATAANNAASAATTTNTNITNAESARVTAEQARATAESARQANEQSRQTAETARVNAESARASAESSRAGAESQRQGNETTRQGNETVRQTQEGLRVSAENTRVGEFQDMQAAFADMQRQIVPQATTSTMGGVIVGDGLNVDNALLSLATTKSGSGTAVASNGAVLESVVVYGQSDQDGTPTPSAPVDVQVVEGVNLLNPNSTEALFVNANNGTISALTGGYSYVIPCEASTTYTFARKTAGTDPRYVIAETSVYPVSGGTATVLKNQTALTETATTSANAKYLILFLNRYTGGEGEEYQLVYGNTPQPYTPYGSIGLVVGDAATSIDLQGNVLASLPDGTRDTVTVDSAGHCVLERRVDYLTFDGSVSTGWTAAQSNSITYYEFKNYTTSSPYILLSANNTRCNQLQCVGNVVTYGVGFGNTNARIRVRIDGTEGQNVSNLMAWFANHPTTLLVPRNSTETIDLGYIDMPTIPEDATISVSASITPTIDVSWWERGAEAIARTVKALSERIKALEEAVAELATA